VSRSASWFSLETSWREPPRPLGGRRRLLLRAVRSRPASSPPPFLAGVGIRGSWWTYEEKETDVSIAVAVVEDAATDLFDVALLVSADSDLCPAIRAVRRINPQKRVVAVFPPSRRSDELRRVADAAFTLGDANIRSSLLPDSVRGPSGRVFTRPRSWR
jgi:hypothetical protein